MSSVPCHAKFCSLLKEVRASYSLKAFAFIAYKAERQQLKSCISLKPNEGSSSVEQVTLPKVNNRR